jgi:gliding motility-associated-like protein
MLKNLILIYTLFLSGFLLAQKEGNQWCFGDDAGIDFNIDPPGTFMSSSTNTEEGCSSISDAVGNLLFYTNGVTVWNKEHEVMPNGDDLFGNVSSTQSALIVKKPGIDEQYYIFTTGHQADVYGLRFSVVDMSLDGGLGDVTNIKNLELQSGILEKLVAVRQDNMMDFWVVVHLWNSNRFHAYEITSNGIDFDPVVSEVGSFIMGSANTTHGYMKANQTGDRLALAHGGFIHDVELFNFNKEDGVVSDPIYLRDFITDRPYGVEFSPDGNVLYCSIIGEVGTVYQYDLQGDSTYIQNSRTIIGSGTDYSGALQLGPDGKIYHASKYAEYLSVIENPNVLGIGCNYQLNSFYLGGALCELGLPNFVNTIYQPAPVSNSTFCGGDSTYFVVNFPHDEVIEWNFGDPLSGENNFSYEESPAHLYADTGSYIVSVSYFLNGEQFEFAYRLKIYSKPNIDFGPDRGLCEGETVLLNATTDDAYYRWQDSTTNATYTVTERGTYGVEVMANSCFGGDTISFGYCKVKIIMPNVFTPNGDGQNDFFVPLEYEDIASTEILIYNRWGKLVYQSDDVLKGWNGKIDGNDAATDTYYYILNYSGFAGIMYQTKGSFALLR